MRKTGFYVLFWILLVNIFIGSSFYVINGYGAAIEINPEFGEAPTIDGIIDDSINEWNEATKTQVNLSGDLRIDLWVMQTKRELFISLQLELELGYHNITEFFGLLISTNSSEEPEDFIDAKFVQFSNISANEFTYLDYHINNSLFLNDTRYDGEGAGCLEDGVSIYEFSIPIEQSDTNGENEDSLLEFDESYACNISYGRYPSYPQAIIKSEIVLINIKAPSVRKIIITEVVIIALLIIVFSGIGVFFGFYIYKIVKLKEKIKKLRS